MNLVELDLFSSTATKPDSGAAERMEHVLLHLADYIYTHTPLKPMSKALFLVSRGLLAIHWQMRTRGPVHTSAGQLVQLYRDACRELGNAAPVDDFSFEAVIAEAEQHMDHIARQLVTVSQLAGESDALGLAFNTLLRGKWESGEGLGTHLTPEEVVVPIVEMTVETAGDEAIMHIGRESDGPLFGDICGGTGRFVYALARQLEVRGIDRQAIERSARLYDQSCMAVDFSKLNFVFDGYRPSFDCVPDSLTYEPLSDLRGRFALLATNPPFGTGKHRWSPALTKTIHPEILSALGMRGPGDTTDPALLFVFRNLDLLCPGGVLGIVLPDGGLHSVAFREALECYERVARCGIEVHAIVSLPSVTFSLGGTVAKTSFVILRKGSEPAPTCTFVASAEHVGFKKRGNRRVPDPHGNDLEVISSRFRGPDRAAGAALADWRAFDRLAPSAFGMDRRAQQSGTRRLGDLVEPIRDMVDHDPSGESFHVSILDVDETGLIDIVAASRNAPVSKSVTCQPGDLLVSCLNPKIWRVTVVPSLTGIWTCSPEFAVLRPKPSQDPWKLFLSLHHASVREAVQAMAGGTSSSRQRVPKDAILSVAVADLQPDQSVLTTYRQWRQDYYEMRLREAHAMAVLHGGGSTFQL